MKNSFVLLAVWLLGAAPALALNHIQSNRIHLFTPGTCPGAIAPVWLTIGTGQAAPGFHNITAPQFDQIGALLTGSQKPEPDATLAAQMGSCGLIASFYQNANALGAWPVPAADQAQLQSILTNNG